MIPINKNRIVQKQATTSVLEFIAGRNLRPGAIVHPEYCSTLDDFEVVPLARSAEPSNVAVVMEQTLDGRDVNDQILEGERVSVAFLTSGDVFLGIAGEKLTKGDPVLLHNMTNGGSLSEEGGAMGLALDSASGSGELVPILIR